MCTCSLNLDEPAHVCTRHSLFSIPGPGFTKGLKQKIVITLGEKS